MQKKLLALAIAGAMVAPLAAQAQNVQIYGKLQPSFDVMDNGDEGGNFIQDNSSRLGFKGSEDLGNGLKAIFQLESDLQFDERNGTLVARDSWVGLAGSFGSLTIGNHQSAYVKSTSKLDPFADSIGDYNNIMGAFGGEADFNQRIRNSIYYASPKFGGFQLLASYALDNDDFDTDAVDASDDDIYSIAATWSSGAFSVIGAYEKQGDAGLVDDDDATGLKLGASFKVLPTTTLFALAERIDVDGDADSRDAYYLGAKHSMGMIDLMGSFAVARESDADDDGAKALALGVGYNFSKRTAIQLFYAHLKNDEDRGTPDVLTHYSMDAGYDPAVGEDTINGFSVRMVHKF